MSQFNRRIFLQVASAASFAPLIPPLSAGGASASTTRSAAQMLWAGMYKNAGATPNVAGLAKTMGMNSPAMKGVYSKLVQSNVVAANSAIKFAQTARVAPVGLNVTPSVEAARAPTMKVDVVKFLTEDADGGLDVVDDETEAVLEQVEPDLPHSG